MSKDHPEERYITADKEGTNEVVRLKNEIQLELMRRYYNNFEPALEEITEWITKNSEIFRQVFDRMIKADPHFWLHDQQTRSTTLDLIEDNLYLEQGTINPDKAGEDFENQ